MSATTRSNSSEGISRMGGPVTGPARTAGQVSERRIEPARLGIILFIVAEIMFFSGLISSFVMFRFSPVPWPPPNQPRLPIEVTSVNTVILLLSGLTFFLALKPLKLSNDRVFKGWLSVTALLGFVFLAIQGAEWVRLLHFGLTLHGSIFGGFFYCLVGTHGIHVLGGLTALLYVLVRAWKGVYHKGNTLGVELCRMYWFFVVALWPVLFYLVYL
jgi:cytochrome c oxidase subunit 3